MERNLDLSAAADLLVSEQVCWHEAVKRLKRAVLLRALEVSRGNQCRASRMLKMHRNTFSRVMKETA